MLLDVASIHVSYGKAKVIHDLSFSVGEGEVVAMLGPNGAGKSTLLKALSGTLGYDGRIEFQGRDVSSVPAHALVALGISHCPEGRRLFPELTVRRNLELGAYLRRDTAAVAEDMGMVFALFPRLQERLGQYARTLSGGEQQMVAIARALMGRPRLLLLDEPSVGIAHKLKHEIFGAIRRIRENGTAILLVEQDASLALTVSDRACILAEGQIHLSGTASELMTNQEIKKAYLGA